MAKVWSPDCYINLRTHGQTGYSFGRALALTGDGQRMFVSMQGEVAEYIVDPAGPCGWTRVGAVSYLSDGYYAQQMQICAADSVLYSGDWSLEDGPPANLTTPYGSVLRASLDVDHYDGDITWYDGPEHAPCTATKEPWGFYGWAVALSGDGLTMAVGQPGQGGRRLGSLLLAAGYGAVFLYTRASLSDPWEAAVAPVKSLSPVAVPPYTGDTQPDKDNWREGDFWGCALALNEDGSRLIVGEVGDPDNWFAGNVYIYEKDEEGDWFERQVIVGTSDLGQPLAYTAHLFGWSICGTPDLGRIFVSAPYADNERGSYRGTVFVFESDEDADPAEDRYSQTERIVSPITSRDVLPLPNVRWVRGFGAGISCDTTGDILVVGASDACIRGVDMDQEVDPLDRYYEGAVFVLEYDYEPEIPDADKETREPEPLEYDDGEGGSATLFPYRPLVPVTESLEWTTDVVEAYDGEETRRGARAIPRQGWEWRVLCQDRSYYPLFRGMHTEQFWVPNWHEGVIHAGAITTGATTLTISRDVLDHGEWLDNLVIWYSPGYCQLYGISSIVGTTVTLSSAVDQNYPAGSTVLPARLCRMGSQVRTVDMKDQVLVDLTWVLRDANDVEPFQLDDAEAILDLPLAPDGALDRGLDSLVQEINYGTGKLDWDIPRMENKWSVECAWFHTSRHDAWERKLWLYSLMGRRGGFWLPTGRGDVTVIADFDADDTELAIERLNYYSWLFANVETDRVLCFWMAGSLNPIIRTVTDVQPDVGEVCTITLDEALGFAGGSTTFPFISWMAPVRPSADRIELSWEAPDRMRLALPVVEVHPNSVVI